MLFMSLCSVANRIRILCKFHFLHSQNPSFLISRVTLHVNNPSTWSFSFLFFPSCTINFHRRIVDFVSFRFLHDIKANICCVNISPFTDSPPRAFLQCSRDVCKLFNKLHTEKEIEKAEKSGKKEEEEKENG